MPMSGPAMACISSGRTSPMAAPTRSATGSTSSFHTGRVASTHSARLQATAEAAPDGRDVASSSHRSARRTASCTAVRSAGPTLASLVPSEVPWETVWRAICLAMSQFTGPPSYESIWPSCWNAAPRSLGFMEPNIAASGLSAPGPMRLRAARNRTVLSTAALLVLLLALVAVLRLLRRKAESEWGVTHGIPRLVRPPVRSDGDCPTTPPSVDTRARSGLGASPTLGLRQDGCHLVRPRHARPLLKTTAGDAR